MVARSTFTRFSISSCSWNTIGTPELQGRQPFSLPSRSLIVGCSRTVSARLVPLGTVTLSMGCTPSRTSWILATRSLDMGRSVVEGIDPTTGGKRLPDTIIGCRLWRRYDDCGRKMHVSALNDLAVELVLAAA